MVEGNIRMQAFEHKDFGVLRAGTDENGEAVFCLEDVMRILGYESIDEIYDVLFGDDGLPSGGEN